MRSLSRTLLTAAAASSLVALAACDNDGSGQVMQPPPPTPTPSPTPTPTPSPTPTPAAAFNVQPCFDQMIPGTGTTVAGAVVPDTLTLNLMGTSGFPNGRKLPDPVIDVTLAVIFLDLTVHSPALFASLPVNPAANDVPFRAAFPYLAEPQGSPPLSATTGTAFDFRLNAASAYVRVDRMGMPAVATALIPSARKNAYNDANPADDATGAFVPDLAGQLTGLTGALADDLVGLGLTPCADPA